MGNHPVLVAKGSLGAQNSAKWSLSLQKEQKTFWKRKLVLMASQESWR